MTLFLGTHSGRIDAKGRVSIPAAFRATLRGLGSEQGTVEMVCWRSHKHDCIEAWPPATFARLAKPLDELPMFSDEHDDLSAMLFAESQVLEADKEGRIVLPPEMLAHATITTSVVFMGLGQIFQIWEPDAAAKRRDDARTKARAVRLPGRALSGAEATS